MTRTLLAVAMLVAATIQAHGAPHRPSAVPSGFVVTPFGYFHPSCVVRLAKGDVARQLRHPDAATGDPRI